MTVTVVTGGASGIGAALCRRLAAPGTRLLLHTGRRRDAAEALADELRAQGAEVIVMVAAFDTQPDAARAVVDAATAAWNGLDRLVHLAGFADRRPVGALDTAGWDNSMATNATAFFHLASAALPALRRSQAGRVVAAGSFLAHRTHLPPDMHFPATSASKAAVLGLVRALAAQLAPDRVTVNCIVPGFIRKAAGAHTALDTAARARVEALVPLGRFGLAEEVAATIAFLLGPDAGYITGQSIHVDGGLTL